MQEPMIKEFELFYNENVNENEKETQDAMKIRYRLVSFNHRVKLEALRQFIV